MMLGCSGLEPSVITSRCLTTKDDEPPVLQNVPEQQKDIKDNGICRPSNGPRLACFYGASSGFGLDSPVFCALLGCGAVPCPLGRREGGGPVMAPGLAESCISSLRPDWPQPPSPADSPPQGVLMG
ncbi:unnamed protein product [Rangifer tarandus platyrhynchus]|uniref:Uncharacterized protein n=1 Tax=Rangifer tarandus platyrhynchus TaxID=3082113 RepID=A0AC60A4Z7_RANTA